MREIKFRAYDKKSKRMRVVESIGFGAISIYEKGYPVCNMIGHDIINEKAIIIHRDSPYFELMQYTGLTDINDNPIWENDIVKFEEELYMVEWSELDACFELYNAGLTERFSSIRSEDCEVIGNKFDNPELLEILS